jgi:hypothetical protein
LILQYNLSYLFVKNIVKLLILFSSVGSIAYQQSTRMLGKMESSTYKGDNEYHTNCTGDACLGDEVRFERAVFTGSYRAAKFAGYELITGVIVNDSYGAEKQQHTFTLLLPDGSKARIKGRNLYANGLYRKLWADESKRILALNEKHARGDKARNARDIRRCEAH